MRTPITMTRRGALAAALAAPFAGIAGAAASAAGRRATAAAIRALDLRDVEARMQRAVDDGTFEGIGLPLCAADGTGFRKAWGADTVTTTHLLGSATKLASTTAFMTLVDDGLVALDDPIRKYLPKFGPVRGAITARQLFAQKHGMAASHPSIPRPLAANGMTLAESVDAIAADDTVLYPAGEKHSYQPAVSYHVAGRIAEVVTGQAWNTLFDERVRTPLRMRTFTYGDTPNPRVGGGAQCALQDYGNLLQMHLAGGTFEGRRVLSEAAVREMQRDQLRGIPFAPVASHAAVGYGLGWWFEIADASGRGVQMSVPGVYGAIPWINLEHGHGGFQLVGKSLAPSSKLHYEVNPLVNARVAAALAGA
jgi:CubicO group peptidase (beta-lactamase class C family)